MQNEIKILDYNSLLKLTIISSITAVSASIIVFIFPWLLVIAYTYFSTLDLFSASGILKIIPVIILLIPFLTAKKPENSKFNYLPAKSFSIMDIVLNVLFFAGSVVLIIMMKNGITIY